MIPDRYAGWDEPVAFGVRTVLPFPTDSLPAAIGDYVKALRDSLQVPAELPGLLALAVLAYCVSKVYKLHVKADWFEQLNLYVLPVLATGERKSSVMAKIVEPLVRSERSMNDLLKHDIRASASTHNMLIARVAKAEAEAARANETEARREAEALLQSAVEELENHAVVRPIRMVAGDVTPEVLVKLLAEQDGKLALISSEGGGIDNFAGRYSSGTSNIDVLLQSYTGDAIKVDRIGREPLYVASPALTIAMTIQPDVLRGLRAKSGFSARGLLGRFLYAVPVSRVGWRPSTDIGVPFEIEERYRAVIECLLARKLNTGLDGRHEPIMLRFDPQAQERFRSFQDATEIELRPDGALDDLEGWGEKYVGNVSRLAAILHVTEANFPDEPISVSTLDRAIRLGQYFVAHAKIAYDAMGMDEDCDNSQALLRWIMARNDEPFSKAGVHRGMQSRFKRSADIDKPLEILSERHYIRRIDVEQPPMGRPPSPIYMINPRILK